MPSDLPIGVDGSPGAALGVDGSVGVMLGADNSVTSVQAVPPRTSFMTTFAAILAQLNSLPATFTRPGAAFQMLQNAKAAGLSRYTNASDALMQQLVFSQAQGVWLDVWGDLFGIPRNQDESDGAYSTRISATLTAGRTTPVAMAIFLKVILGIDVNVIEDLANVRWNITFNRPLSDTALAELLESLNFIRPAGVPSVTGGGAQGGTYLGSVDYLGAPRPTGAYFGSSGQGFQLNISAYTNNSRPLLPTTFLSDPTLNPGLSG